MAQGLERKDLRARGPPGGRPQRGRYPGDRRREQGEGSGIFRSYYVFAYPAGKYATLLDEEAGAVISYCFVDLDGDPAFGRGLVVEYSAEPYPPGRGHSGRCGLGLSVFGWDGKAYSPQKVRFDYDNQALVYKRPRR